MKRLNQLNIKRGLLSKLVLFVALLLGSSNAWGDAKSLPYSYGFENNDLASEGWTIVSTQSMSSIQTTGNTGFVAKSGSYSFRFYYKTSEEQYLISPLLANSDTGVDLSFYYNNNGTGSNSVEKFQVGYSTTTSEIASFNWDEEITSNDTEWHKYESSYPANVKYIAIKYSSASKWRLYVDDINIEISETYKRPKNFTISSFTNSSATLSWINGDNETAWEVAYSTKEDFDPKNEGIKIPVTNNPYTLTGLTDGVTYYAYVRSNYSGNYSEYSNKINFTPEVTITANNGTGSSSYIPFTGASVASETNKCQFIIPSNQLTEIQNRKITALTFYTSASSLASANWGTAKFDIYLKNTTKTTVNSSNEFDTEWGTKVYSAKTLSLNDHEMIIILDNPFLYTSDNLMVGFDLVNTGTNSSVCNWITNPGTYGNTMYSTGSVYKSSALPKVTIESVSATVPVTIGDNGYTTFACPRPLDLTTTKMPEGLKAYKAEVDAENGKVIFTDINQKVAANTGILLASTDNETYTYNIPVADSGDPVDGNAFLVNSTGGTFLADDGYTYFGFKKNSAPITFATFDPSTVAIPTNKAYLKVLTKDLPTEAHQLVALFDDGETTSLREIRNEELGIKNAVFFNLNGQRVAQPTKGLYIVNGKKVLVP